MLIRTPESWPTWLTAVAGMLALGAVVVLIAAQAFLMFAPGPPSEPSTLDRPTISRSVG